MSASGKIQPKHLVNISADTMGRVTNLAVEEGDRVKKDQFLLQIDPRNLRSASTRTEASVAAAGSQMEQLREALESASVALKQAEDNYRRQQDLWKGGLTTRETLERPRTTLKMRQSDLKSQEQNVKTQQLRMEQEKATLDNARVDLSKVRIESPIDGIVTRRNIEEGETVVDRHDEQRRHGAVDGRGHVGHRSASEVDETDMPTVALGQKTKITIDAMPGKTFSGKVTEIGNSPIQTAGGVGVNAATNFLVKVELDSTIPDVRPGFTCTAEITTATRDGALGVPIQAMTVREMVVDKEGNIVRDSDDKRRAPEQRRCRSRRVEAGAGAQGARRRIRRPER